MSSFMHKISHTCTRMIYSKCGCGSGDSGCKECGCCRVCAGEKDHWGGGAFNLGDIPDDFERVRAIREKIKGKKKEKKKDKDKEKDKKEDKSAFGLQLLFGGT